jgi:hypothetical protein
MISSSLTKLAVIFVLCLAVCATASAQYGGGGGGGGMGGGGTGGSGGSGGSGSTASSNNSGGLSTGAKVGIGVGAAAGVTAVGLLIHHHHQTASREQASLIGCTESVLNGLSLKNETDNQTYTLLLGRTSVEPGERVELTGSKGSTDSINQAFHVRGVVKDYGACGPASGEKSTLATAEPLASPAGTK